MASSSWDLDQVTSKLRAVRTDWRERHSKVDTPAHRFPSTVAIEQVVERVAGALYPQRLGAFAGQDREEDAYVSGELRNALSALLHQLNFEPNLRAGARAHALDTATILREFAAALPVIRQLVDADIEAAHAIGPADGSVDEILLCASGPVAILRYRLAHQLHVLGAPLIARIMARAAFMLTGIFIHPAAEIGPHFRVEEGSGTMIGGTVRIGAHVSLSQGVTLGGVLPAGQGHGVAPVHSGPLLEDHVIIHAGATVIAGVTVGRGSVVGPNVSLTTSLAPDSIVVQAHGAASDRTEPDPPQAGQDSSGRRLAAAPPSSSTGRH